MRTAKLGLLILNYCDDHHKREIEDESIYNKLRTSLIVLGVRTYIRAYSCVRTTSGPSASHASIASRLSPCLDSASTSLVSKSKSKSARKTTETARGRRDKINRSSPTTNASSSILHHCARLAGSFQTSELNPAS